MLSIIDEQIPSSLPLILRKRFVYVLGRLHQSCSHMWITQNPAVVKCLSRGVTGRRLPRKISWLVDNLLRSWPPSQRCCMLKFCCRMPATGYNRPKRKGSPSRSPSVSCRTSMFLRWRCHLCRTMRTRVSPLHRCI